MESGTGIKNKLLEAMAAGAPAVATPLACQGIDASHALVADSDADFAAGLVALLRDRARAASLAEGARAYVRERHDWDAVASSYMALYEAIA
jgi:glycosyltransferase involved in cell wall biosynthesis